MKATFFSDADDFVEEVGHPLPGPAAPHAREMPAVRHSADATKPAPLSSLSVLSTSPAPLALLQCSHRAPQAGPALSTARR